MTSTEEWIEAVVLAGGHTEPPPSPNVPDSDKSPTFRGSRAPLRGTRSRGLRLMKRKHVSANPTADTDAENSEILCSSKRPRPALAEIESPNMAYRHDPQKKQRAPTLRENSPTAPKPDETPRQSRRSRRTRPSSQSPHAAAEGLSLDLDSLRALGGSVDARNQDVISIDESADSRTSKRSSSPTKRMVDLRIAEKRIIEKSVTTASDVPNDVSDLYLEIQTTSMSGVGIIPRGMKDHLSRECERIEPFLPFMVSSQSSHMDQEQLVQELKEIVKIRNATSFCNQKNVHEPSWNERVHSRLLQQAIEGLAGLEYHNITTARVIPRIGTREYLWRNTEEENG